MDIRPAEGTTTSGDEVSTSNMMKVTNATNEKTVNNIKEYTNDLSTIRKQSMILRESDQKARLQVTLSPTRMLSYLILDLYCSYNPNPYLNPNLNILRHA
jgi:hypothetical protein